MATDSRRTNYNAGGLARGLTSATGVAVAALNHGQIDELQNLADASGCKHALAAPAVANDVWVLAPAASQANTLTIQSASPGHSVAANGVTTVQVADNGSDALSVTYTAGALKINLANSTDANNTLTLIKAAIDLLNTSTNGCVASCYITGTASTQMVHGGTNTLAATAAGGTAGTSLKSSTAGSGVFSVLPN